MKNVLIYNYKNEPITAELVTAFICKEINKSYIAINNGDLVFSRDSSYNNLDILEVVSVKNNEYHVQQILDEDWEAVQKTLIDELFSKIK